MAVISCTKCGHVASTTAFVVICPNPEYGCPLGKDIQDLKLLEKQQQNQQNQNQNQQTNNQDPDYNDQVGW